MEETIELVVKVKITYPDKSSREDAIKRSKEMVTSGSIIGLVGCQAESSRLYTEHKDNPLFDISQLLPSHLEAAAEAKLYGDEMNKLSGKPNAFHEVDFYNGVVWLMHRIEALDAPILFDGKTSYIKQIMFTDDK